MARLYSTVTSVSTQGPRKARTIGRSARNEITAHTRGWNLGVEVRVTVDPDTGLETFFVYKTGGTNNPDKLTLLKAFTDTTSAGPRDRKGRLKT